MVGIPKAKRSGGPKTEAGKLSIAQNSLKTGAYSGLAVLPGESQDEFNRLVDQFNHDFHPSDVIETSLVRDLAVLTWKKLRLEKLEQSHLILVLEAPIKIDELKAEGVEFHEEVYKPWVNGEVYDLESIEPYKKAIEKIKELQDKRLVSLEDLLDLKKNHASVYDSIISSYKDNFPLIYEDLNLEDVVYKLIKNPGKPECYFISIVLKEVLACYKNILWVLNNKALIDQSVSNIKQRRLVSVLQTDGLRRANDDLIRSFTRTLSEFRKHNEWRMRHRVIDAEEE